MTTAQQQRQQQQLLEEYRAVFESFDVDGGGMIDACELHTALNELGIDLPLDEVSDIIKQYGHGDGSLDFDEFCELLQQFSSSGTADEELDDELDNDAAAAKAGCLGLVRCFGGGDRFAFMTQWDARELSDNLEVLHTIKERLIELLGEIGGGGEEESAGGGASHQEGHLQQRLQRVLEELRDADFDFDFDEYSEYQRRVNAEAEDDEELNREKGDDASQGKQQSHSKTKQQQEGGKQQQQQGSGSGSGSGGQQPDDDDDDDSKSRKPSLLKLGTVALQYVSDHQQHAQELLQRSEVEFVEVSALELAMGGGGGGGGAAAAAGGGSPNGADSSSSRRKSTSVSMRRRSTAFERPTNILASTTTPITALDRAAVQDQLSQLANFGFEKEREAAQLQGAEAFRMRARDFPFFMFPIDSICQQLDALDDAKEKYENFVAGKQYLLKPRCPDGKKCPLQDIPEHKIDFTHPCYCPEEPCIHLSRPWHMKCYSHVPEGTEESASCSDELEMKHLLENLGRLDVSGHQMADSGAHCMSFVLHQDLCRGRNNVERNYKELNIADNQLSPAGAIVLLDVCADLTVLDLSGNSLGYRGALLGGGGGVGPALRTLLQRSEKLTELNLSKNRLTDSDARYISEGLKLNNTLKHLDLRKNEFGPSFGDEMAAALNVNTNLKELLVGWNRLHNAGTSVLLNELRGLNTIEVLDLSWTGITEEGGLYAADMIAGSTSLRVLSVAHNAIGKASCAAITKALIGNRTLQQLDVSFNPLGERATGDLVRQLVDNTTLETLDIRCCKAGPETMAEVHQTMKIREPKMAQNVKQRILFSANLT